MIYFFFLLITFALPAMDQEKPDPSKNTDGTCWLTRMPTDILNYVLMPLVLEETDEEFIARAKRNYEKHQKPKESIIPIERKFYGKAIFNNPPPLETRHGKVVFENPSSNTCSLSLYAKENNQRTVIFETTLPQGRHYRMQLNLNRDQSKLFFIYSYALPNCVPFSHIRTYDLSLKKYIWDRHTAEDAPIKSTIVSDYDCPNTPGEPIASAISGSGNYVTDVSRMSGFRNIGVYTTTGKMWDMLCAGNPRYATFNNQETKILALDKNGFCRIMPIPKRLTSDFPQKSKIHLQEYLRQKGVCKNLLSSLQQSP